MDQSNDNNVNNTGDNARRKFMIKAGSGALLASLPAKSVWATGTLQSGSIVASSHASTWGGQQAMALLSPGFWKQQKHTSVIDRKCTFFEIFNGVPCGFHFNQEIDITEKKSVIKIKAQDVCLFDVLKNPGKKALGGDANVNFHMVAMCLNAANHGSHGIYYPIIGYGKPYTSVKEYARFLYQHAMINPGETGRLLSNIITQHHAP